MGKSSRAVQQAGFMLRHPVVNLRRRGGGLSGLVIALVAFPESLSTNFVPVALILIPSLVFLYLIFTRPGFLLVDPATPEKINPQFFCNRL